MDRARLLEHFDALAETPDAVEKLRKLVLDLAIRGRLVPQNPKDEPALRRWRTRDFAIQSPKELMLDTPRRTRRHGTAQLTR